MGETRFRMPRQKLSPGDRVAVLSPSFAAPGFAPAVHEQAMRRIESDLHLVPVEYPTTRARGASPEDRAADVMAAFADPGIRAIFATIGGDDQITLIRHLDVAVVAANPKPFFRLQRQPEPPQLRARSSRAGGSSSPNRESRKQFSSRVRGSKVTRMSVIRPSPT